MDVVLEPCGAHGPAISESGLSGKERYRAPVPVHFENVRRRELSELVQIIEYAHARVGLNLRPQLFALRLIDAQTKASLRDSQDGFAATTHQKHEGRGDRHAAPAVPRD